MRTLQTENSKPVIRGSRRTPKWTERARGPEDSMRQRCRLSPKPQPIEGASATEQKHQAFKWTLTGCFYDTHRNAVHDLPEE